MDFSLGSDVEDFREEVIDALSPWIDEIDGAMRYIPRLGADREIQRALGAKGWLTLEDEGSMSWDLKMLVLSEEADRLGIPISGLATTMMVGFTLMRIGTPEQKAAVLPRIASGDLRICLGYSEPGAGSDIASVRTRARRDGDHWIVDGQKQWTSHARSAEYIWLLTRSDPDVQRHKGLTVFLVPIDTPGITIVPLETLASDRTNQVFFDEVRIPDACRVGEVHGGWQVLTTALVYEHGGGNVPGRSLTGALRRTLDLGISFADRHPDRFAAGSAAGAQLEERLAEVAIDLEIARLLSYRATWEGAMTEKADVSGAILKAFARDAAARAAESLLDMTGAAGLVSAGSPWEDTSAASLQKDFLGTQAQTVAGGSLEIQRNIIADRGLGLPRAPRPAA